MAVSEPLPVDGLFEAHLTVGDLSRAITFYRDVVGLPLALTLPEREAAFFWIGAAGRAMLGLWTTGSAPIALSLHVAFGTSLENVLGATGRLRALGVTPLSFHGIETTEPSVIGDQPDPERGITTWCEWNADRPPRHADSVVDRIRDALPGEAAALEALHRRAADVWEEYRPQLVANPDAIERPDEAIEDGRVRVAVDSAERPLGFSVVLAVKDGRCELDDLHVEPDSMGRGVGRLLVADVASRATAAGASQVDVTANPNALGFYERLGFEITGDASTRFGPGIRMSLLVPR